MLVAQQPCVQPRPAFSSQQSLVYRAHPAALGGNTRATVLLCVRSQATDAARMPQMTVSHDSDVWRGMRRLRGYRRAWPQAFGEQLCSRAASCCCLFSVCLFPLNRQKAKCASRGAAAAAKAQLQLSADVCVVTMRRVGALLAAARCAVQAAPVQVASSRGLAAATAPMQLCATSHLNFLVCLCARESGVAAASPACSDASFVHADSR